MEGWLMGIRAWVAGGADTVGTAVIQDDAVTNAKIAPSAVGTKPVDLLRSCRVCWMENRTITVR